MGNIARVLKNKKIAAAIAWGVWRGRGATITCQISALKGNNSCQDWSTRARCYHSGKKICVWFVILLHSLIRCVQRAKSKKMVLSLTLVRPQIFLELFRYTAIWHWMLSELFVVATSARRNCFSFIQLGTLKRVMCLVYAFLIPLYPVKRVALNRRRKTPKEDAEGQVIQHTLTHTQPLRLAVGKANKIMATAVFAVAVSVVCPIKNICKH